MKVKRENNPLNQKQEKGLSVLFKETIKSVAAFEISKFTSSLKKSLP